MSDDGQPWPACLVVVNRYPPQSVRALAEMGGFEAHLLSSEIEEIRVHVLLSQLFPALRCSTQCSCMVN
jgi:hypothetical protein